MNRPWLTYAFVLGGALLLARTLPSGAPGAASEAATDLGGGVELLPRAPNPRQRAIDLAYAVGQLVHELAGKFDELVGQLRRAGVLT